jgi:hypothetical protein
LQDSVEQRHEELKLRTSPRGLAIPKEMFAKDGRRKADQISKFSKLPKGGFGWESGSAETKPTLNIWKLSEFGHLVGFRLGTEKGAVARRSKATRLMAVESGFRRGRGIKLE